MTVRTATARLAYCVSTLADPTLSDSRRSIIDAKAATYRAHLSSHCERCGRPLSATESVERGTGPVCAHAA